LANTPQDLENGAASHRRDFVLNTSITEIILLLFFLLLLLLAYTIIERNREQAEQDAMISRLAGEKSAAESQLKELTDRVNRILSALPTKDSEKVQQVLVAISRLDFELAANQEKLTTLQGQIRAYETLAVKHKQGLPLDKFRDQELTDLGRLAQCTNAQKEMANLTSELSKARESRLLTERDASQRIREALDKVRRCGGKGEEFVACWRDGNGSIQYMFNLTLNESGIEVQRAWPDERVEEMARFSEATGLVGKTVNLEQFLQSTSAPFESSKVQTCRHFVRVYGKRSEMNPSRFRDYRGVQDHFYHFAVIK